ncbi:MAG: ATP-binding cassette domain-containing protein [Candidatus Omnitrophica bacterium]|nr:ATP-binding cassette domain-containing protein [Candidatus Omnitrophota bacterium]
MNDSTALSIKELSYTYGRTGRQIKALKDLDLQVSKGHIFGFIGPNGAGKTTTIKLMLGILTPRTGSVSVLGGCPSSPRTRARIGYMPEISDYYGFLSARELLVAYGDIFNINRDVLAERIERLLDLTGLTSAAGRRLRELSKGMLQKVSFAQSLINDPDILVLDEPTSGLDPIARQSMRAVLSAQRRRGKTVFFSSHELSEVELICDRIGILRDGELVAAGSKEEVLARKGRQRTLEQFFVDIIKEDR